MTASPENSRRFSEIKSAPRSALTVLPVFAANATKKQAGIAVFFRLGGGGIQTPAEFVGAETVEKATEAVAAVVLTSCAGVVEVVAVVLPVVVVVGALVAGTEARVVDESACSSCGGSRWVMKLRWSGHLARSLNSLNSRNLEAMSSGGRGSWWG